MIGATSPSSSIPRSDQLGIDRALREECGGSNVEAPAGQTEIGGWRQVVSKQLRLKQSNIEQGDKLAATKWHLWAEFY